MTVTTITKAQEKFLKIKTRGGIYKGGIGAGKSHILCVDAISRATDGAHVAIVSFSYVSLRDTILVKVKELLELWGFMPDVDYVHTKSEFSFEFPSTGGKIILRSGDAPNRLRGLTLNFFYLDEAREFPDNSIYKILIGRLRREGERGWRICTTTKGHSWFWNLEGSSDVTVVKQSTLANPFLPQDYIDDLLSQYTSDFARQELYADEVSFGAGIIKDLWFQYQDEPVGGQRCRFWDLATGTKEHNDFSAGALVVCEDGKYYVVDVIQEKLQWPDLKEVIMRTAEDDGIGTTVVLENAGQQVALYDDLCREPRMAGFDVRTERPNGSKMARLMAWASRLERGQMKLVPGPWNQSFVEEATSFTADDSHQHDDMLDAVSGAYQYLSAPKASLGFL